MNPRDNKKRVIDSVVLAPEMIQTMPELAKKTQEEVDKLLKKPMNLIKQILSTTILK